MPARVSDGLKNRCSRAPPIQRGGYPPTAHQRSEGLWREHAATHQPRVLEVTERAWPRGQGCSWMIPHLPRTLRRVRLIINKRVSGKMGVRPEYVTSP